MAADSGSRATDLTGKEDANVDDKGRVLFSKAKRDELGGDFVMRWGDNGCIFVYPLAEWDRARAQINKFESSNPGRMMYTRLVNATAEVKLNFDGQGRVVIPKSLRELAGIDVKVVILGCEERAEIWDAEEYQKYMKDPLGYGKERVDQIKQARREMREEKE